MNTPTDTPTALEAWHARAMELAEVYAGWTAAVVNDDEPYLSNRDAARAALSAHLLELPMGEPAAYEVPKSQRRYGAHPAIARIQDAECFGGDSKMMHDAARRFVWSPLYRHPKDTA